MNLEGKLIIHLALERGQVAGARVESLRPLFACRVLEGRDTREAVSSIALLFSLCGRAQTTALALAIDAAQGHAAPPEQQCQRALHVLAEAAREHYWRLLIDLPRHLGESPDGAALAAIKSLFPNASGRDDSAWWDDSLAPGTARKWTELADALDAHLASALLGEPVAAWLSRGDAPAYSEWLAAGRTPLAKSLALLQERNFSTPCLGFLEPAHFPQVQAALSSDAAFARAPQLEGGPVETGPLASNRDVGLVAQLLASEGASMALRVIARVVALARIPARLRALARADAAAARLFSRPLAPGRGGSAVETARGWLIHDVEMDGDRLARLAIVAPTEWNFHPQGAFAQGMTGQAAADAASARSRAALLAFALDPCVMWEIGVE